jgi:glyoxylase I family protein
MPEVIGIDHIYIAVSEMAKSEQFYDDVFEVLGFRKQPFFLDGEPHIQYYNRHFGYVLRPARSGISHGSDAPGLHHLCFRVQSDLDVNEVAGKLKAKQIDVSEPRRYTQYAPDYVAIYFSDPDGLRLEITNYRAERRQRHDHWDAPQS